MHWKYGIFLIHVFQVNFPFKYFFKLKIKILPLLFRFNFFSLDIYFLMWNKKKVKKEYLYVDLTFQKNIKIHACKGSAIAGFYLQ